MPSRLLTNVYFNFLTIEEKLLPKMNGLLLNNNFDEFSPLVMGHINLFSILAYDVQYVGPSDWPKN